MSTSGSGRRRVAVRPRLQPQRQGRGLTGLAGACTSVGLTDLARPALQAHGGVGLAALVWRDACTAAGGLVWGAGCTSGEAQQGEVASASKEQTPTDAGIVRGDSPNTDQAKQPAAGPQRAAAPQPAAAGNLLQAEEPVEGHSNGAGHLRPRLGFPLQHCVRGSMHWSQQRVCPVGQPARTSMEAAASSWWESRVGACIHQLAAVRLRQSRPIWLTAQSPVSCMSM